MLMGNLCCVDTTVGLESARRESVDLRTRKDADGAEVKSLSETGDKLCDTAVPAASEEQRDDGPVRVEALAGTLKQVRKQPPAQGGHGAVQDPPAKNLGAADANPTPTTQSASSSGAGEASRNPPRWQTAAEVHANLAEICDAEAMKKIAARFETTPLGLMYKDDGTEFDILLQKSPECDNLGIKPEQSNLDHLVVLEVEEGMIRRWNDAHPELPVCKGCRILEVNGFRGPSWELVDFIQHARELRIRVRLGTG